MTSPVHTIPDLPVLGFFLVVGLAITAWRLHEAARFTWPRAVSGVAGCVYGVGVAKEVLQPFQVGIDHRYFPGWRAYVHLTPLVGAEPSDLLLNVLLFLPFGVLLPLLARVHSTRRAILIGFLASLTIELTQLLLDVTVSVGRVADVNDLIGNTLGACVGYLALKLAVQVPPLARVAAAVRWPAPHRSAQTRSAKQLEGHGLELAQGAEREAS